MTLTAHDNSFLALARRIHHRKASQYEVMHPSSFPCHHRVFLLSQRPFPSNNNDPP